MAIADAKVKVKVKAPPTLFDKDIMQRLAQREHEILNGPGVRVTDPEELLAKVGRKPALTTVGATFRFEGA